MINFMNPVKRIVVEGEKKNWVYYYKDITSVYDKVGLLVEEVIHAIQTKQIVKQSRFLWKEKT